MTFASPFSRVFERPFGGVPSSAVVLTNFFNQLYTGTRNNFSGTLGFRFTPSRNIIVTALGRSISTAMAADHVVRIWSETPTVLATVTVTSTSSVDALGYAYELLATPITLISGTKYRIASVETSGGDKWMDVSIVSNHLASAAIDSACYAAGNAYPNTTYGGANQGYVLVTFYE